MTDDSSTQDDSQVSDLDRKALQAELESVKAENERLLEELENSTPDALKEMAARAQADLQNAKERMERESADIRSFALAGMLGKLLPTIDNFQRAFAHLPEDLADHDWVKGVQAMEQEFMKLIAEAGLEQIESLGLEPDPEKHEVLQSGSGEDGKIVEVFEEGYALHGKVLRPAKVKVGDGN